MIIVDNIDNLIVNDNMDIIITDVNKFKSIKIIKSFNKYIFFVLDIYFRQLSSYLLFYYNYTKIKIFKFSEIKNHLIKCGFELIEDEKYYFFKK